MQQVMNVKGLQDVTVPPLSRQVLENLTNLQSGASATDTTLSGQTSRAPAGGPANVLRELKQSPFVEGMGQLDSMMIGVVAMMFDYILDDAAIPTAMKALVGRLQTALLKVALLDKTFFVRKFHPARKLLNRFAEAVVGWPEDDENTDEVHGQLETLVQLSLNDFDNGISIFTEVDEALDAFLQHENHSAQDIANSSTEALEARARLATADSRAAKEVERVTSTSDYRFLDKFLKSHWSRLLATVFVQSGDESANWSTAVQTMDDLAWSVSKKSDHKERLKLVTIHPAS